MKIANWHQPNMSIGSSVNNSPGSDWLLEILGKRALDEGRTLYWNDESGKFNETCTKAMVEAMVKDVGAHLYTKNLDDEELTGTYITDYSYFSLVVGKTGMRIRIHSIDRAEIEKISAVCKGLSQPKPAEKKGSVFVLIQTMSGLKLQSLGMAGENFQPDNYMPEVSESYKHVVEDLNRKNPCGRIAVLDGPPGTGKTHMIRALLNEAPEVTFILVQSHTLTQLGNPEFIPVLLDARQYGTLAIILEDADECLSSRKADNVAAISALLNFTDGIFGALLDIRVIATTNVKMTDIDEAVMRPGRLCKHIHIARLGSDKAKQIYTRLMGDTPSARNVYFPYPQTYSLGEIYSRALKDGAVVGADTEAAVEEEEPDYDY